MIDLDHLEKYVSGDTGLRAEILSIFVEQARTLDTQFADAASDEAWRNTAHALKGASRGVGAWALGDLCEEAEDMIGAIAGKEEKRAAILVSIRNKISEAVSEAERVCADAA